MRRSPDLRAMHASMLLSHAAKWGGSNDAMFEFARKVAWSGSNPSGAAVVLVQAHEYAFEQVEPFSEASKSYWRQMSVRGDVMAADDACRSGGLRGMNGVAVRQWLAYGLWRSGEFKRGRDHFEAIGKTRCARPWDQFNGRLINWLFGVHRKARKQCMRA
jgi:hypothetical protein